jgi:DNA polymerase/3'-5' exonuclease PolX
MPITLEKPKAHKPKPMEPDTFTLDDNGRTRWKRNEEIAARLKQLGEFLVIGGYEETHAARYARLAYTISRYPLSVVDLYQDGRLSAIEGIGDTIAGIVAELLESGTCRKWEGWARHTPPSVLELTTIPGLGAKTIRTLYQNYDIDSLSALQAALDAGRLDHTRGIGAKTLEAMRQALAERFPSRPATQKSNSISSPSRRRPQPAAENLALLF